MDFQVTRTVISPRSINLVVQAIYTTDEAEALSEAGAWHSPCVKDIYAIIGVLRLSKPEETIRAPTFQQLSRPGILIQNFSPYYADRFEANFLREYGKKIQQAMEPYLGAFMQSDHQRLEGDRDDHMGRSSGSHNTTSRILKW
ncbi:MAG TPA: hypothetical protein VHY35_06205 [Stellaceae bacterium]|nr:hypothetical protein [Stellaceae bacterium]